MRGEIELPAEWDGWRITDEIGSGANSRVYRAVHTDGSHAAVKVIPGEENLPSLSALAELTDCPGVVRILKIAVSGGNTYLMMEELRSFADEIRSRSLTEGEMIRCLADLAGTLCELEQRKLLHRDIKPENILIDDSGKAVLCDVDQARLFPGYDMTLTIQGSFSYMAPEVYHGAKYDYRADLYSLGMVFYRCANGGRAPFVDPAKRFVTSEDLEQALIRRMKGEVLPSLTGVSAEFADILMRICDADPKRRYQSAGELSQDLERLVNGTYQSSKRSDRSSSAGRGFGKMVSPADKKSRRIAAIVTAAVLVLLLLAGGSYLWLHEPVVPRTEWSQESGVSFTINRMGTARFTGSGIVDDLEMNRIWQEEAPKVRRLIVEGGISEFSVSLGNLLQLREVVIGDGVERLGRDGQFSGCTSLTKVILPDSLCELPENAFAGCTALEAITIPHRVDKIPTRCFAGCIRLSRVDLPESLTAFGEYAFDGTLWLEKLGGENRGFAVVNHCLIGTDRSNFDMVIPDDLEIRYLAEGLFAGDNVLCSVVIPDGVETIPCDCFSSCTSLSSVVLPGDLKAIDDYAFRECASLSKLTISDTVDVSAAEIFVGTPYLENLRDDDGFAVLNGTLLSYEGEREEVVIPQDEGIHTIAEHAFWANRAIRRVVIPDSIKQIKQQAFFMCLSLEDVSMPDGIEEIGFAAFAGAIWQP